MILYCTNFKKKPPLPKLQRVAKRMESGRGGFVILPLRGLASSYSCDKTSSTILPSKRLMMRSA